MKRKISLFSIIILYSLVSFSQGKKYVYYFDEKLNTVVRKSKSAFTGTGTIEAGILSLTVTDNKTDQTVIRSHYTDSSLAVRHGRFESFFNNGRKESEGNYENGKEDGLWKKWDDKGRLTDSMMYDHGKKLNNTTFKYYRKSTGYRFEDFINDKMLEVFYDDSGKVTTEANFTGNSGILKTYGKDGVKTDSVFSRQLIEASYPGGDAAWARYIKERIMENIAEITMDNQSGTCRLKFIVDKEGNVTNVEVLTMKGSVLAIVAKNALLRGPMWNPAIQYGKAVNAYREQPVTFTMSKK